ncbi:MAG: hypothetical protein U0X20_09250 [Caldilineaceae bacterium]
MIPVVSFGKWVQMQRSALHLTQGELARRIFCSEIMIRKIEGDERRPSTETAQRLAVELRVPANLQARLVKIARGELSIEHLPELPAAMPASPAWPAWQRPTQPLAPTTSFVGRTRELAQICDLVLHPETRLLTLVGPPGIGKTRLGLHVAGELQYAFLHGVTYVPLAPVRDPALVVDTIAQLLGYAEAAFSDPLDFLCFELRAKHRLLVLDNFEQVLPASRHISILIDAAPKVTILVTSRSPLNLSYERLWPVPPLAGAKAARSLPVEVAIQQAAVQLFVTRARDVDPDFALTADNVQSVCELCDRLDGLPLAIELAAARVRLLTPQALLSQLSNRLDFLATHSVDRPTRHHTLHNAIGWSVDLLPTETRRVYARLGVFLRGATLEAAQTVCAMPGGSSVLGSLSLLVDHSLVRSEQTGRDTRFAMLETTRDYALELLVLNRELEVARSEHAQYYLNFAETRVMLLLGADRRRQLEIFDAETDNLRAALRWAQECSDGAMLSRLVAALGWFWELHGRRNEARSWLAAVFSVPLEQQPPSARMRVLHMAGHIASEEGDLELSRHYASESRAMAERFGDKWCAALAQRDLTWVYFAADNNSELGIASAEAAADELLSAGDRRNYMLAMLDAAMICQFTGNAARGEPYAQVALRQAQEWDDEGTACEAMSTLALLAYTANDYDKALALLEECLVMAARLPNGKQLAWQHYKSAQVYLDYGNLARATEHFAEGGRLWAERNEVLAVAFCQSGQANCLFRQGAFARAKELYETTLVIYRQFNAHRAIAWTLWNLAHVAAVAGSGSPIEALLGESLAVFRRHHDSAGIASCEAAMRGEWTQAREPIRL